MANYTRGKSLEKINLSQKIKKIKKQQEIIKKNQKIKKNQNNHVCNQKIKTIMHGFF